MKPSRSYFQFCKPVVDDEDEDWEGRVKTILVKLGKMGYHLEKKIENSDSKNAERIDSRFDYLETKMVEQGALLADLETSMSAKMNMILQSLDQRKVN